MKNQELIEWFKKAGIRSLKTFAQTAVAVITIYSATAAMQGFPVLNEINWVIVGSASLVSAILSLATSLAGLPEVDNGKDIVKIVKED